MESVESVVLRVGWCVKRRVACCVGGYPCARRAWCAVCVACARCVCGMFTVCLGCVCGEERGVVSSI